MAQSRRADAQPNSAALPSKVRYATFGAASLEKLPSMRRSKSLAISVQTPLLYMEIFRLRSAKASIRSKSLELRVIADDGGQIGIGRGLFGLRRVGQRVGIGGNAAASGRACNMIRSANWPTLNFDGSARHHHRQPFGRHEELGP